MIKQPPRKTSIDLLKPQVKIKAMCLQNVAKKCGLNMVVFETLRTKERQDYLYSIGRTTRLGGKPVTRTKQSLHLGGKAIDRVFAPMSRSGDWGKFRRIASKCGFDKIPQESCHTQDNGKIVNQQILDNSGQYKLSNDEKEKYLLKLVNETFRELI